MLQERMRTNNADLRVRQLELSVWLWSSVLSIGNYFFTITTSRNLAATYQALSDFSITDSKSLHSKRLLHGHSFGLIGKP